MQVVTRGGKYYDFLFSVSSNRVFALSLKAVFAQSGDGKMYLTVLAEDLFVITIIIVLRVL